MAGPDPEDVSSKFLDPRNSIGYRTRIAFRYFSSALERRTAPFGVSAGQWRFLRQLWLEDGLTQAQLSRRVGTRQPTTVRAVNSLVRSGFATRSPSGTDRRKIHVRLTPLGKTLCGQLIPLAIEVNAIAARGVSAEALDGFLSVLAKITENLIEDGELIEIDEP